MAESLQVAHLVAQQCVFVGTTALKNAGLPKRDTGLRYVLYQTPNQTVRIDIEPQSQPFGGARWWFKCPQCSRRCGRLYAKAPDESLRCRRCLGLAYLSSRYCKIDRLLLQRDKLLGKLEISLDGSLRRPKWMRRRTYERLKAKADEYDTQAITLQLGVAVRATR